MAEVQLSGPLALTEKFTYDRWRDNFGTEAGIVGDTDGSAFGLTLPSGSDVAELGSATIDSVARIGGFPVHVPAGTTQSMTIPASAAGGTNGRTDLIVARFDSATFTTAPGPSRLHRIAGTDGSLSLPAYTANDLRLYAVRRKQGEGLNQAIVTDLRSWTADPILVAPTGTLPSSKPLGTRATRAGITYLLDMVEGSPQWVQEWTLTNAAGATVYDTGWINLSMTTGWKATTGQTPQVRRLGPMVYIRGRVETISGSNVSGSLTPCYIPPTTLANTCRPSRDHDYVQQVTAGGGSYRIWIATDGTVNAAGFPSDNDMYIATSYAVD